MPLIRFPVPVPSYLFHFQCRDCGEHLTVRRSNARELSDDPDRVDALYEVLEVRAWVLSARDGLLFCPDRAGGKDGADTWFLLMHPELTSGAWIGFNDHRLTFRTNFWAQGDHSALPVVGDYYRRMTDSEEVSSSMEASFPLPQDDSAPETMTNQGEQMAW